MTTAHETTARRLIDAMDRLDFAGARELVSADARVRIGGQSIDREMWFGMGQMFGAAFPDGRHTVEDVAVDGDRVVLRCTWRGTHQAPFQGIPATGRAVAVPAILFERYADGRLAEVHGVFDALGLMQQIGALPGA